MKTVQLIQTGLTDYRQIWQLQKELFNQVTESRSYNYLIITEHHPVITIGKTGSLKNLLVKKSFLESQGVEIIKIDRGGDVTFHGPGQIIGYPILNLSTFREDIDWYLRKLEEVIIKTLRTFQIKSDRVPGLTGVWVGNKKICAVGVKVTRWVSMHGFALNYATDLNYFDYIIPCGISDKGVTSVLSENGNNPDKNHVINTLCSNFEKIFAVKIEK